VIKETERRFTLRFIRRFVGLVFCFGLAVFVVAEEGAQAYRHHVMEAIGGHGQAIGDIMKGDVPHMEHLAMHVNAMADLAKITYTLFPEGSEGGEALPVIWEEPEEFSKAVERFATAAEALRKAVNDGAQGEIGGAVREMFMACKGCHDDYREVEM